MNGDPFEFAANAYALKATLTIDGEDRCVMLFSLQNPICVMKNRFLYDNSTFFAINQKVLNLRQNIDVVIIDDTVYLLTLAGEKLFNIKCIRLCQAIEHGQECPQLQRQYHRDGGRSTQNAGRRSWR